MARKRTISPEIWTDEKVLAISWRALPFYIGTINLADDEGRIVWSARQLHAKIVSVRPDVPFEDVPLFMAELERELISVYHVDGKAYAYHPAWHRIQYVNRPTVSQLPDPPGVAKRYILSARGGVIDTFKTADGRKTVPETQGRQLEFAATHGVLTESSVIPTRNSVSVSDMDIVEKSARAPSEFIPVEPSRAESPGRLAATWFVTEGIARGALAGILDPPAYANSVAETAARLVAAYGRAEFEVRAVRLFESHASTGPDRIMKRPGVDVLESCWSWRQLAGAPLRNFGDPRPSRAPAVPIVKRRYRELLEDGSTRIVEPSEAAV